MFELEEIVSVVLDMLCKVVSNIIVLDDISFADANILVLF